MRITRIHHLLLLILFIVMQGVSTVNAAQTKLPGQEFGIAPHRALYEVKLKSSKSGSQIVNIQGHMYYDWAYDCDAWTSKHRFNVLYEYADSPAMRISSDFSNRESYDSATLNYSTLRRQNGKQYEEIRGHAIALADAQGEAIYNHPAGLVQKLPANTLFPMAHTLAVLKAAKEGEKFINATIFDGSDEDGPVEINAFIGKAIKRAAIMDTLKNNKALDKTLINGPARQIGLAFFPLSKKQDQPDYEMKLTLHDNGVISDMVIDYNDFSVSQTLIAIEPIDPAQSMKACQ